MKSLSMACLSRLLIFCILFPISVFAQNFTAPATDQSVNACTDYFTDKWATPLDMSQVEPTFSPDKARMGNLLFNITNIINGAGVEFQELSGFSYSNGTVSMSTTGDAGFFRLLTPESSGQILEKNVTRYGGVQPISAGEYALLTFRMRSSQDSNFSVRVDKAPGQGQDFSDLIPTFEGWGVYQVDLNSLDNFASSLNHGLGIFPARFNPGTDIEIDWIQLTPSASNCDNFSTTYTALASDVVSVFTDTDSSLSNGVIERTLPATGSTSVDNSFNSSKYFPGTYKVLGLSSHDFATHYLNPWDMNSASDIVSSANTQITPVGSDGFSGGEFCFQTTGNDPSFRLRAPGGSTANSAIFNQISLEITGIGTDTIELFPLDANGATTNYVRFLNTAGDGVYQLDLTQAANTGIGEVGDTLPAEIGFFRIDPGRTAGKNICVRWASLSNTPVATEPTVPAPFVAGGDIEVGKRAIAPFVQPDIQGGRDYFSHVRGNTANFDATSDFDLGLNIEQATLFPGNSYTDNSGAVRIDDYFQGQNPQSGTEIDGDPQIFMILRDTDNPLDSNLYKIACARLNLQDTGIFTDHTVLRFGWETGDNFDGFTSDDIVLKTVGEATYCVNLDGIAIEENNTTIIGDFYNDARSFRVDPHEVEGLAPFRLNEVRLAADHEADNQFALVVGGDRDLGAVAVFKNTARSTTGGTLIGTLADDRNSDVLLWDTSGEPDGARYHIYSTINGRSLLAEAPVIINHSFPDNLQGQAPTLDLQAPPSDGSGRYDALDLAGHAFDNVRLAVVEVLIDGDIVTTFLPDLFLKDVRDANPSVPFISQSAFQKSISLDGFADGAHTLTVKAWDTEGNATTVTRSFTKANSNLTDAVAFPVPNEQSIPIDIVPPVTGEDLAMTSRLENNTTLVFSVTGAEAGQTVRIKYADSSDRLNTGPFSFIYMDTVTDSDFEVEVPLTRKLKVKKKKLRRTKRFCKRRKNKTKAKCLVSLTTAFFGADLGDGSPQTDVIEFNPRRIKTRKKVRNLSKWLDLIRLKGTKR